MNRIGGFTLGMGLLMVFFILAITSFALIEPFKESLDNNRGGTTLNCPGTSTFNQTAYDLDTNENRRFLTRRPTCFITGISMIWFISAFIIAAIVWLAATWRKK